jgi:hypothetical protein
MPQYDDHHLAASLEYIGAVGRGDGQFDCSTFGYARGAVTQEEVAFF